MGLVNKVGRKQARSRIAIGVLYGILVLGALTTLFPFAQMVSGSLKGPTDQNDNRLVPLYLSNTLATADPKVQDQSLLGKYLADKYAGDAAVIGGTRLGEHANSAQVDKYRRWLESLDLNRWTAAFRTAPNQSTGRLTIAYQAWLRQRYPSLESLNSAYTEQNGAFQQVVPPPERLDDKKWKPVLDRKWKEWLEFKAGLPAEFRNPIRTSKLFQDYWKTQTKGQFKDVPADVAGDAKDYPQLKLPASGPRLDEFKAAKLPSQLVNETNETLWQKEAPGAEFPIAAFERQWVAVNEAAIRQEFMGRNYRYALDYVLLNGRVLFNTALFCILAVLVQLVVNPLAAYALSRYPIRATQRILLFLLATMAFPAEVAMIPSFLLLKDLGLLNTFAALVLPGAASGYMIYLLKGFFDSLPQELFEAGQLDGARESQMLLKVAIPLSKPVLGYLALLAFMGAYGAFMYAFLVAQDRRLWTLMVWIYQLQGTAPKSVMMAALTLAALPTLTVFLLAQRVILRGIVLPGER